GSLPAFCRGKLCLYLVVASGKHTPVSPPRLRTSMCDHSAGKNVVPTIDNRASESARPIPVISNEEGIRHRNSPAGSNHIYRAHIRKDGHAVKGNIPFIALQFHLTTLQESVSSMQRHIAVCCA